jgi:hypothetical protein
VAVARTAPIVLAERLTDVLGIVILIVAGSASFRAVSRGPVRARSSSSVFCVAVSSDRVFQFLIGLFRARAGPSAKLAPKVREAWSSLRTMTTPAALVLPTLLSIFGVVSRRARAVGDSSGLWRGTPVLMACFFYATATLAAR